NDAFTVRDECSVGRDSRILLPLARAQVVYAVVDHTVDKGRGTVTVAVTPAAISAPSISSMVYVRREMTVSVRGAATDGDGDLDRLSIAMIDAGGGIIGGLPLEGTFEELEAVASLGEDGTDYTFVVSAPLNPDFADAADVAAVEVRLGDASELWSAPFRAEAEEPEVLERGEACDPDDGFTTCAEADACFGDEPLVCREARAPVLAEGRAVTFEGTLGVEVSGVDPDGDALGVEVVAIVEEGDELARQSAPLDALVQDDDGFTGRASFRPFVQACIPSGQAAFDACLRDGGSQNDCADQADLALYSCEAERVATLVRARVWGVDATGKRGEPIEVMVSPRPVVEAGEVCDGRGVFDVCVDELACFNLAEVGA
ncbi:MAG: hypothetical protein QF464_22905, partial [Myxococcota bacterium]|nr:hypothetical protein [Myxococcota bacterium]